jgi:hypothetical protein
MAVVRAESVGLGVMLTEEELTTQIRTIILAGYETTSCKRVHFSAHTQIKLIVFVQPL